MEQLFASEKTLEWLTTIFYVGGALGGWLALLIIASMIFFNWVMTYRPPKGK